MNTVTETAADADSAVGSLLVELGGDIYTGSALTTPRTSDGPYARLVDGETITTLRVSLNGAERGGLIVLIAEIPGRDLYTVKERSLGDPGYDDGESHAEDDGTRYIATEKVSIFTPATLDAALSLAETRNSTLKQETRASLARD